jgi:predicted NBD/HSP70 family sugar kinase
VTATVYDAAHEDDALALEVVRDTARYLGAGVANLINVFNRRPSSFAAESPSQASA